MYTYVQRTVRSPYPHANEGIRSGIFGCLMSFRSIAGHHTHTHTYNTYNVIVLCCANNQPDPNKNETFPWAKTEKDVTNRCDVDTGQCAACGLGFDGVWGVWPEHILDFCIQSHCHETNKRPMKFNSHLGGCGSMQNEWNGNCVVEKWAASEKPFTFNCVRH